MIVRRFYGRSEDVAHRYKLSDVWLRIAVSDPVLDIVNGYTGQPRKLTYVDNGYTVPNPNATKRVASQRWHRDPDDDHIVKMFIYFSDVDEEACSFEYVRDSAAGGRYGDLFAWEKDGDFYPPGEELEAAVDSDDRLTMTGPAGTVIFCDTAGFHRGGYPHETAHPDGFDVLAGGRVGRRAAVRGRFRGSHRFPFGAGPAGARVDGR